MTVGDAILIVFAAYWVAVCAKPLIGKRHAQPARRIVPTRPEKRSRQVALGDACNEFDNGLVKRNEGRIVLAYRLGLDLALHRGSKPNEWLIPGEAPSAPCGFVVVQITDE